MEESFVGDPILWPGLVYGPLNRAGLIFALGTIASSTGLLFEEFADDLQTAVCRRKTRMGWERLKVAFAVQSSQFRNPAGDTDLLICWVDDAPGASGPARLELSKIKVPDQVVASSGDAPMRALESILPDGAVEDLLTRGKSRESYEETINKLDEQIRKLRSR